MREQPEDSMAMVELENVGFSYAEAQVLHDINLSVGEGEFVVIVGKSGSGKSTLLRVIGGLLEPSGVLRVRGKVRMVFQEDRLFPWYRVHQNVAMAIRSGEPNPTPDGSSGGTLAGVRHRRARALLHELGMAHLSERYPQELSGGEKQRVAIARAFAGGPQVVLMDEPFGALDVLTREQMQTWLLRFWQRTKAAVIFVTHDVEEGLILGDRIMVLAGGTLLPGGQVSFPRPRAQDLRYARPFLEARQRIRAQLLDEGAASSESPMSR